MSKYDKIMIRYIAAGIAIGFAVYQFAVDWFVLYCIGAFIGLVLLLVFVVWRMMVDINQME